MVIKHIQLQADVLMKWWNMPARADKRLISFPYHFEATRAIFQIYAKVSYGRGAKVLTRYIDRFRPRA